MYCSANYEHNVCHKRDYLSGAMKNMFEAVLVWHCSIDTECEVKLPHTALVTETWSRIQAETPCNFTRYLWKISLLGETLFSPAKWAYALHLQIPAEVTSILR